MCPCEQKVSLTAIENPLTEMYLTMRNTSHVNKNDIHNDQLRWGVTVSVLMDTDICIQIYKRRYKVSHGSLLKHSTVHQYSKWMVCLK